jgi:hypothetical protein
MVTRTARVTQGAPPDLDMDDMATSRGNLWHRVRR